MSKIYERGTALETVPASSYLMVKSDSPVAIYKQVGYPNVPEARVLLRQTIAGEIYKSAIFTVATDIEIVASEANVEYDISPTPAVAEPFTRALVRSTIAGSATITVAQLKGGILYQDTTSAAAMTTPTAALIAAAFPNQGIGASIDIYVATSHVSNKSTISGGTGVTIIGLATVINDGAQFKLIKTATTPTYDVVRVG